MRRVALTLSFVLCASAVDAQGIRSRSLGSGGGRNPGLQPSPRMHPIGEQEKAGFGVRSEVLGDVDGDGLGDVLVSARWHDSSGNPGSPVAGNDGKVYLFSSRDGWGPQAAWSAEGPVPDSFFGFTIAAPGDVNGDGYSDAMVAGPWSTSAHSFEGVVALYYGSSKGLELTPSWLVFGGQENEFLGSHISGAGDVNADGYPDVLVAGGGNVHVYLGSAFGLALVAATTLPLVSGCSGWIATAGVGDVNADGYQDVVVCNDMMHLFLGSPTGLQALPDQSLYLGGCNEYSLSPVGDVNGDGYADVVRGYTEHGDWRFRLFQGSPTGFELNPNFSGYAWGLGEVRGLGDVDRDGFDDILLSTVYMDPVVHFGSLAGLGYFSTSTPLVQNETPGNCAGMSSASVGDLNADGVADIVFGDPYFSIGQDVLCQEGVVGAIFYGFGPGWQTGAIKR